VQVVKLVVEVLHVQRRIHRPRREGIGGLSQIEAATSPCAPRAAAASGHLRAEPRRPVGDCSASPRCARVGHHPQHRYELWRSCRVVSPSTSSSWPERDAMLSTSTISSPRTSSFAASRSRPQRVVHRDGLTTRRRPARTGGRSRGGQPKAVRGARPDPGSVAIPRVAALTRRSRLGASDPLRGHRLVGRAAGAPPPWPSLNPMVKVPGRCLRIGGSRWRDTPDTLGRNDRHTATAPRATTHEFALLGWPRAARRPRRRWACAAEAWPTHGDSQTSAARLDDAHAQITGWRRNSRCGRAARRSHGTSPAPDQVACSGAPRSAAQRWTGAPRMTGAFAELSSRALAPTPSSSSPRRHRLKEATAAKATAQRRRRSRSARAAPET